MTVRDKNGLMSVDEFLEGREVDPREYMAVARKYARTCWEFYGCHKNESGWNEEFKRRGWVGY